MRANPSSIQPVMPPIIPSPAVRVRQAARPPCLSRCNVARAIDDEQGTFRPFGHFPCRHLAARQVDGPANMPLRETRRAPHINQDKIRCPGIAKASCTSQQSVSNRRRSRSGPGFQRDWQQGFGDGAHGKLSGSHRVCARAKPFPELAEMSFAVKITPNSGRTPRGMLPEELGAILAGADPEAFTKMMAESRHGAKNGGWATSSRDRSAASSSSSRARARRSCSSHAPGGRPVVSSKRRWKVRVLMPARRARSGMV